MAKTQYSIRVTFNKAILKANELETIARSVDTQRGKLGDCQRELADRWKGNGASQYYHKLGERMQELSDIAKDLRSASAAVKEVARTTYEADRRALALARERKRR